MKRLTYLILLILLIALTTTACNLNQAEKNGDHVDKVSPVTSKINNRIDQPKDLSVASTEQKKEQTESSDPSIKDQSTVVQSGQITDPGTQNANTVTLMITKDFGKQLLFKDEVTINEGSTVMDMLIANTDVITKYDGNYVSSIKGLASHSGGLSGSNADWFYYMNGICSDGGADDYVLKAGELIWWDYHEWKGMGFVNSAVIGSYPEPFTHGYRGKLGATTVMSSDNGRKYATELEVALRTKGVSAINIAGLNNSLLEKRQGPTIVIGTWKELQALKYLDNFNHAYRKTGTSIHFTDEGLELLDYTGNVSRTMKGSAGIIVAAGSGLGDDTPLWIIAGTDQAGVQQAVDVLTKNPGGISSMYSAVIHSGEIIRLPLQ